MKRERDGARSPHPSTSSPSPPPRELPSVPQVDKPRAGSFKCGDSGRDLALAGLAVATYSAWLEARAVRAGDFSSGLPVSAKHAHLRGADVDTAIQALADRYGASTQFNLLCSRSCRRGGRCHGEVLAVLFEKILSGAIDPPWPRELKISVGGIMNDLAILMHLSYQTGIPVFQLTSDVKDLSCASADAAADVARVTRARSSGSSRGRVSLSVLLLSVVLLVDLSFMVLDSL